MRLFVFVVFGIVLQVSNSLAAKFDWDAVNSAVLQVSADFFEFAKSEQCRDMVSFFDERLTSPDENIRAGTRQYIIQHVYFVHDIPSCTITKSLLARAAIEQFEVVTDISDAGISNKEQKQFKRLQSRSRQSLVEILKPSLGSLWLQEAAKTLRPPLAVENAISNMICSDVDYKGGISILDEVLMEDIYKSDKAAKWQLAGLKNRLQDKCSRELTHATKMGQKKVCVWAFFAQENTNNSDYLHFPPSLENLYKSYGMLNGEKFERLFINLDPQAEFSEEAFLKEFPQTSELGLLTRRFQIFFVRRMLDACEARFSARHLNEIKNAASSVLTISVDEFARKVESAK